MRARLIISLALVLTGCGGEPQRFDLLGPESPLVGQLAGTVLSGGVPVAEAQVSVTPGGFTTATDPSGRFGLQGIAPGRYAVAVQRTGFSPTLAEVDVRAGEVARPVLQIAPGGGTGIVAGSVTDGVKALEGVTVQVQPGDRATFSTTGGVYRIEGLAPGLYDITASAPGFLGAGRAATVTPGGVARVDLVLGRRADGQIVGTVTDGLRPLGSLDSPVVVTLIQGATTATVRTPTGTFQFQGLPTGPAFLSAAATGFFPAVKSLQVIGGTSANGDIVMTRDGSSGAVAGTVTDRQFLPLEGARIESSAASTPTVTLTGANGRYVLRAIPPGDVRLDVTLPGFAGRTLEVTVTGGNTEDGSLVLSR